MRAGEPGAGGQDGSPGIRAELAWRQFGIMLKQQNLPLNPLIGGGPVR